MFEQKPNNDEAIARSQKFIDKITKVIVVYLILFVVIRFLLPKEFSDSILHILLGTFFLLFGFLVFLIGFSALKYRSIFTPFRMRILKLFYEKLTGTSAVLLVGIPYIIAGLFLFLVGIVMIFKIIPLI